MGTDVTHLGRIFFCILFENVLHPFNQHRTMAVKCHDISLMSRQTVVHHHFTSSRFIQYGHFYPITEFTTAIHQDDIHVFDKGIVTNLIVGYIVLNVFNATMVADCHIVQRGLIQASMLLHATCQRELVFKYPESYLTGKTGIIHIIRLEVLCNFNVSPIVCRTGMGYQLTDFLFV